VRFAFPVLVCDIGGTNVRFAVMEQPGAEPAPAVHRATADYNGLSAAIQSMMSELAARPRSVIACGAGPVAGRSLQLTNASWLIDGPAIAADLSLDQGLLLNDFEAQALSLPVVRQTWTMTIGEDRPPSSGPRLILGPGTGLGIAALLEIGGRFVAVASEACHIDFGPSSPEEMQFWPFLEPAHGRITSESLISGPGLVRLHRARMARLGKGRPSLDAVAITERANADSYCDEADTIRVFWQLVARFSGDMAITFLAKGGVTLAGGVLPRLIQLLDAVVFRDIFDNKAPVDRLARSIPVRLLTHPDSVIAGMAAIASNPERYEIDFSSRAWRG
jgi:glucokinase